MPGNLAIRQAPYLYARIRGDDTVQMLQGGVVEINLAHTVHVPSHNVKETPMALRWAYGE